MILNADTVPNDGLAVDVSARTLTSEVVVPLTGAFVGAMVASEMVIGISVEKEIAVAVTGKVAVTNSGAETVGVKREASHPVQNKRKPKMAFKFL